MGIRKIHILKIDEPTQHRMALQAQAALQAKLVKEHQNGQHRYGSMRRECPLCVANNKE